MSARFRLGLFGGLLLLVCLALLPAAAHPQQSPLENPPHITVTGHARQNVLPDGAVLTLAVVTEKPKAEDAESANAAAARALIETVKGQGIPATDIKTVSVTLTPVYSERRDLVRNASDRVLQGYRARNSLRVKLHDLSKIGGLTGKLVGATANELDGIRFTFSRKQEVYNTLRREAVQDAQRRARAYLSPLGLSLGRVLEVEPQDQPVARTFAAMAGSRKSAAPVPVEAGTLTLKEDVRVTWEIAQ